MYNEFQFDLVFTKETKNFYNLKKCIKSKRRVQIDVG